MFFEVPVIREKTRSMKIFHQKAIKNENQLSNEHQRTCYLSITEYIIVDISQLFDILLLFFVP